MMDQIKYRGNTMDKKINILIVEDNQDHIFLIKQMLLKIPSDSIMYFEYDIKDADSLKRAMELLKGNKIDIVLLDLGLPDSQELESLKRILSVYPEIPVIIQTALGNPDVITEALNNGAEDYLLKGEYDTNLLSRSIRHSIERRKVLIQKINSEKQIRTLIEKNFNPMFVINKENIIQYINESAAVYFGKQRSDLIGGKYGYSFDVNEKIEINITKNNSIHVAEVRTVKINWEDRESFLITLNDITDMKSRELGLKKEVETFQSFFHDNKLPMLLTDPETENIIQANPMASKFYGYPIEELEGMYMFDIINMSEEEIIQENRDAMSENRIYVVQNHNTKTNENKKVKVFNGNINLTNKILKYHIILER